MNDAITSERLRELERFAEIGRLSASLLHEISNPLTAAMLYFEQAGSTASGSMRQVQRNIRLLQRYVEAARQQVRSQSEAISFYTRQQLDQISRVLTPLARRAGVGLCIEPSLNYKMYGDPVKFQQIIANLIMNAIDSYIDEPLASAQKQVIVSLKSSQQWLMVRVRDRGVGISAEQLPLVFEPFYSTKAQRGHGLGIGLALSKEYVEKDFLGTLSATSSLQHGTEFQAKLRLMSSFLVV